MDSLTFDFTIDFPGEPSAGLRPYTETVAIVVESGNVPEPAQFAEHMKQALADWFDGATVVTGPRHRGIKVESDNSSLKEGKFYDIVYVPHGARTKTKELTALYLGQAGNGQLNFSGRPLYGTISLDAKRIKSILSSVYNRPREPR